MEVAKSALRTTQEEHERQVVPSHCFRHGRVVYGRSSLNLFSGLGSCMRRLILATHLLVLWAFVEGRRLIEAKTLLHHLKRIQRRHDEYRGES